MILIGIPSLGVVGNAVTTPSAPTNNLLVDLVSYWKLDEASGTRNDSHGSNHLTDNNTVGSATGKISNAAVFVTANSEYLSCASNSTLQMSSNTDFTFSFWIKLTSSSNQQLITKDDDAGSARDYTIDYVSTGSGLRFYIQGGGTYIVFTTVTGTTGTWYHVVAWYDNSNGQLHLRIDDTTTYNSASTGATGTDVSAAQFRIGAREYASFEGYADATIDEVALWKRVLGAGEITELYNGGAGLPYSSFGDLSASLLDGLVVYYALEDLTEEIGGLTLTNNNSATFGAGKVGDAVTVVASSSQYLSRADNAAFQMGIGDFTIACWIKSTDADDFKAVAIYGERGNAGYGFTWVSSTVRFFVGEGFPYDQATKDATTSLNDGNWHLVVGTCDRTAQEIVIYWDGSGNPSAPQSCSAVGSVNNSVGFKIGAHAGTAADFWDGSVDELGIWNRVLTAAEIDALYLGGAGTTYPF